MSLFIYQRHLDNIPKQYRLLKLFRPPIYVIELSNNQLIAVCYYKDGSSRRHQVNADFSNRRMVIADFFKALANVTEELADGLTSIEIKGVREVIWAASRQAKRSVISTAVSYQGQVVSQ